MQKKKRHLNSYPTKMDCRQKYKSTIKLQKNTGENLCKSTILKRKKTGKLDLIKLKDFVLQKLPIRQSKVNFRLRENIFKSYI